MSEKKYVVPTGMLNKAYEYCPASFAMPAVERMLEAALRWQSENPIVPTAQQVGELVVAAPMASTRQAYTATIFCITEWQRRMFLAPEPVEDYADRILKNVPLGTTPTHAELDKIWNTIFRAGHGWTPPELRNRGDEFGEKMNDLTVEVNRLGMSAAIEILQRTR
jgi:hypothetical protein